MNNKKQDTTDALERSLCSERERLQQDIERLRQEIAAKQTDLRAKEKRLGHVRALLTDAPQAALQAPAKGRGTRASSTPTPQLLDMAEAVLRERDAEPMHYRELAEELMRRGAVILGKDPAAALVSRMTQDDNRRAESDRRFVRPTSKGFYALREFYPQARNVGARRRGHSGSENGRGSEDG